MSGSLTTCMMETEGREMTGCVYIARTNFGSEFSTTKQGQMLITVYFRRHLIFEVQPPYCPTSLLYILRNVRKIANSSLPSAWNNWAPTGRFSFFLNLNIFRKSIMKIQVSLNSNKNNGYFTYIFEYMSHFFLKWGMSQAKSVEKIKTHILCPVTFFRESCRFVR